MQQPTEKPLKGKICFKLICVSKFLWTFAYS